MNRNLILKSIFALTGLVTLSVNAAIFEVKSNGYLHGELKFFSADNTVKSIRQSIESVSTFRFVTTNEVETSYAVFDGKNVVKITCAMTCHFNAYEYLKLPVDERPLLVVYRYEN